MPEIESYNILVIGSGEAGKYLAWTMAKAGHRTAVVERKYIGGSCPNIACLPSKNVIHSAKVASLAARAAEFGVEVGPVATNMKAVQLRKRKMVEDLIKVHSRPVRSQRCGTDHGRSPFRFSENRHNQSQ